MKPGATTCSLASISSAHLAWGTSPTARMRSPLIATSAATAARPLPSITFPRLMMRSGASGMTPLFLGSVEEPCPVQRRIGKHRLDGIDEDISPLPGCLGRRDQVLAELHQQVRPAAAHAVNWHAAILASDQAIGLIVADDDRTLRAQCAHHRR